jgi:glutathione S-transferase
MADLGDQGPITVWGRKDSSNVQKVVWCCDELGVGFERIDIGGRFGGNKESPYLRLNPNGLVPTIKDGDFILWESNSVVRYLTEKYGRGKLTCAAPEERANCNRWMDWQLTTVGPAMAPLFQGLVRTLPEKRDSAALENSRQKAARAWGILNDHLDGKPYVAGNEFTMGDIPLGVWVYRWFQLPVERPELSHLKAWYDRLCRRPGFQKHIMIPLS